MWGRRQSSAPKSARLQATTPTRRTAAATRRSGGAWTAYQRRSRARKRAWRGSTGRERHAGRRTIPKGHETATLLSSHRHVPRAASRRRVRYVQAWGDVCMRSVSQVSHRRASITRRRSVLFDRTIGRQPGVVVVAVAAISGLAEERGGGKRGRGGKGARRERGRRRTKRSAAAARGGIN